MVSAPSMSVFASAPSAGFAILVHMYRGLILSLDSQSVAPASFRSPEQRHGRTTSWRAFRQPCLHRGSCLPPGSWLRDTTFLFTFTWTGRQVYRESGDHYSPPASTMSATPSPPPTPQKEDKGKVRKAGRQGERERHRGRVFGWSGGQLPITCTSGGDVLGRGWLTTFTMSSYLTYASPSCLSFLVDLGECGLIDCCVWTCKTCLPFRFTYLRHPSIRSRSQSLEKSLSPSKSS